MQTKPKSSRSKTILIVVGSVLILGGVASLFDKPRPNVSSASSVSASATSSVPAGPRKPTRAEFESSVRNTMKDPDSAKFSEEMVVQQDNGAYLMCGNVNGKNAFGGYTGKTPFIAGESVAVVQTPETANQFVDAWNKKCADRPAEDA